MKVSREPVIVIDRTLMFYLAAGTRTKPIEVAATLMDLSHRSVNRMQEKGGTYRWNKFTYPDTEIKLKAKAERGYNEASIHSIYREWFNRLKEATDCKKSFSDVMRYNRLSMYMLNSDHDCRVWIRKNPPPNVDYNDHKCITVTITLDEKLNDCYITQHDIDNFLIENILLG